MKMKPAAMVVLGIAMLFMAACGGGSASPGAEGTGGSTSAGTDGGPTSVGTGGGSTSVGTGGGSTSVGAGGGGACACTSETSTTTAPKIRQPWDCFCGGRPQTCEATKETALAAARANSSLCYALAEYPGCGITALHSVYQLFGGWSTNAFDAGTKKLVGVEYVIDTSVVLQCQPAYAGPPSNVFRSGRLPNCEPTSCEVFGNCVNTLPPPCRR